MRFLAASLLLSLAAPAFADAEKGVSHFTLDNGLDVVVIEDARAPSVVQMLWYKIGSADEAPGKSGIAHYLEHLMFKGTDTLEPGELSRRVTANGGMDNAFTSYDFTTYFQRIASDRLEMVMEMEADRMSNLRIGDDDWQAERQVVLEERAQRVDSNPRALFAEERSAVQFYNHPYGRPVIGWRAEMEALTRDDAEAWYDAHYAPNNAVLVIAGDVTEAQVRDLAERYYGPAEARPEALRSARPQEPAQQSPRRMELRDPRVAQPVFSRSVLVPQRVSGDQDQAAALTVLAALLGGSPQTSVLAQEMMMEGTALFTSAGYSGLSVDPTTFTLMMVPADGLGTDEAEAALDAVLARFLETGPDADQLERIKTTIRADQIFARDSAHGRAYEYGQGLAVGLTVEDVADWPNILAEVSEDDVMAAAELVLNSRASVTGWLLPAALPSVADAIGAAEAELAAEPGAAGAGADGDTRADEPSGADERAADDPAPEDDAQPGETPAPAAPQPGTDDAASDSEDEQ